MREDIGCLFLPNTGYKWLAFFPFSFFLLRSTAMRPFVPDRPGDRPCKDRSSPFFPPRRDCRKDIPSLSSSLDVLTVRLDDFLLVWRELRTLDSSPSFPSPCGIPVAERPLVLPLSFICLVLKQGDGLTEVRSFLDRLLLFGAGSMREGSFFFGVRRVVKSATSSSSLRRLPSTAKRESFFFFFLRTFTGALSRLRLRRPRSTRCLFFFRKGWYIPQVLLLSDYVRS